MYAHVIETKSTIYAIIMMKHIWKYTVQAHDIPELFALIKIGDQ